jgi:hypothetical protein
LRKLIVLGILVLVTVAGMPSAMAGPTPNRFEGFSNFVFGGGCGFVAQTYDAKISPPKGSASLGSFHFDGCATSSSPFHYDGTASVTLHGSTRTGTVSGTVTTSSASCPTGYPNASDLDFIVVLSPSGRAHVTGLWCSNGASGGPIRGHIVGT